MRVIPPIATPFSITPAMFTSSTCVEPDAGAGEVAYNPATAYAAGAAVIVAADHRTYQSLQAANTGHTPLTSPAWWLDIGPTNAWAMFDSYKNTQTESASPLVAVITPGIRVNSLALDGLEADQVEIKMTSGATTVYDYTANLNTREVVNWYDYYYAPFSTKPGLVRFDLPPITDGVITVTLKNSAGPVKCGTLLPGNFVYIGDIEWDPDSEELNFSTIDRDVFGTATLVPRRSVPQASLKLSIPKVNVGRLLDVRKLLNAVPALWSALDDEDSDGYFRAFFFIGIYTKWTVSPANAKEAEIQIDLEGI